jgi:3-oxoadipate enol-lactonase
VKLTIGDVEFGYDRAGSGDAVMLVMGLGAPRIGWFPQFHFLSQQYDVASFDNRGVGETVCPSPWTMADMASDVVALADSFGHERFHLVGISMGGMISQEIVLTYPDRVRSLTLIATSPGGPESEAMSPAYAAAMSLPDPEERMRKATELTFGTKFRQEKPELMELILSTLASGAAGVTGIGSSEMSEGFMGQLMAVVGWMGLGGAASRLKDVTAPTLVMHGGDDQLLPVGNGKLIAREVPGAKVRIFEDAGHALNAEYPDEVNAELIAHFEAAAAKV